MATSWYVKAERGTRGPMSFQDVAFLIRDGQLRKDSLVRQVDNGDWREANTVVGLLRSANQHSGLDERIIEDDEQLLHAVRDNLRSNQEAIRGDCPKQMERQQIVDATISSIYESEPLSAPNKAHGIAIWGPAVLIFAATACAIWAQATHDPFAGKDFERISEPDEIEKSDEILE